MTQETYIEIAQAALRRRWRLLLTLCICIYPLAVIQLRFIELPYTAQVRLFALPQNSQNLLDGPGSAFLGVGGSTDRTAFLSGQEALLRSNRVFQAVAAVDPDLAPKIGSNIKVNRFARAIGEFQEIIFGADYVKTRQKWKNREFAAFKQRISIEVDLDSASVSLKYKHVNPQISIKAVHTAAEALQKLNAEFSRNHAEKKVLFLESKIRMSRAENDRISEQITDFIRKYKISNDPRTVEPRYKGFSDANELVTQSRLEISQRETALAESRKVSARLQAEIKQGFINDREGRLKNLTAELRRYDQAISKTRDEDSKNTNRALKREIAQVRSKISQEFASGESKMDVASLQALLSSNETSILEQEAALRAAKQQLEFGEVQAKKYENQLSSLPELSEKLAKLTMVQTQQRKILELLTQRYLEAQIENDTKLDQLYVTEEPTLTDADKLGKLPILLSLIALITILVAVSIALIDLFRGVLLTKNQLTKFQSPLYIGSVPFESELRTRRAFAVVSEIGVGFRLAHALRRQIFSAGDGTGSCKVVSVTSKQARVGKTVTSMGIAAAFHSRGLKTLIIDADYMAQQRSLKNQLSESITHITSLEDILTKIVPISNPNSKRQKLIAWSLAEEFGSEDKITEFLMRDFARVVETLKQRYDCIVIDCAPCFISSMLLIYEQADVHVLCFAEGKSTITDVIQVSEVIEPACKEGAKMFSVLTIAHLRSNAITSKSSDGIYYRPNRAA